MSKEKYRRLETNVIGGLKVSKYRVWITKRLMQTFELDAGSEDEAGEVAKKWMDPGAWVEDEPAVLKIIKVENEHL